MTVEYRNATVGDASELAELGAAAVELHEGAAPIGAVGGFHSLRGLNERLEHGIERRFAATRDANQQLRHRGLDRGPALVRRRRVRRHDHGVQVLEPRGSARGRPKGRASQ